MIKKIMLKKTGLNKTFVINVVSTILLQGFAFVTMPIFSRILGSEQYGYYAIYISWVNIFASFLSLNIGAGVGSGAYKFKNEYYSFKNSILMYTICFSLVGIIVCVLLYPLIVYVFSFNIDLYLLVLFTAFSSTIISTVNYILIYEKMALLKFIVSFILAFGNFGLSLIFILLIKPKELYLGKVYGHFISYLFIAIFLILYFLKKSGFRFSTRYLKFCLLYGLPLVFHALSANILNQSDRIMMQKLGVSVSNIGVYSLVFTFSSVMSTILFAFNNSYVPFYYDYIEKNDKESIVNRSMNYSELFTVLSIGFLMLSREVISILAPNEFYSGIELIPIFVASTYCTFLYHFPVNFEFFHGNTVFISIGTIIAALFNIILNYFLIGKYGMYGAAIATFFASLLLYIFHYIIAKSMKKEGFHARFINFFKYVALFIIFAVLFYVLKKDILVRWLIGAFVGIFELYRIFKRKYIF